MFYFQVFIILFPISNFLSKSQVFAILFFFIDPTICCTFCSSPKYSSYFFPMYNYLLYFLFKFQIFVLLLLCKSNYLLYFLFNSKFYLMSHMGFLNDNIFDINAVEKHSINTLSHSSNRLMGHQEMHQKVKAIKHIKCKLFSCFK